jgi:two-component system OmpR family response regulator
LNRSARILLVEDDESLRLIAQLSLETLGGHEVHAFASGEEAVLAAAAFAPDLLVLDVSMPGMDGPQTLHALREQPALASVPAVFLTANTQAAQVDSYRKLGALDVIAKPFDPQFLCDRVSAVLMGPDTVPAALPQVADAQPVALVIEDDGGIRYLLRFILEQEGWRVLEAIDGPDGERAIATGELADAVLMDIMLPGVDGLELLTRLRALRRWEGVPVMMLTAKGDEPTVRRALAAGANDYLGKPFDPADLLLRLRRLPLRRG